MAEILKYKWALIGTVLLHCILFFGFRQFRFESRYEPLDLTEMPVLFEPEDLKKLELLQQDQLDQNSENEKVENKTFNEADQRGQSEERYDSRNFSGLNESVDEEVRNFEKQAFEDMKADRESKYGVPDYATKETTSKQKPDSKSNSNTNNAENTSRTLNTTSRVAASYDLSGRRDEFFAKPSYLCKGQGKVVVKIKVNRSGRVVAAELDAAASKYTEECMGETAKKYAMRCKFEASTKYADPQHGTITYTFIAQ